MKNYILTFIGLEASMLLSYNEKDLCVEWTLNGDLPHDKYVKLVQHFPWRIDILKEWGKKPNISVRESEPDLSFENFWEVYAYKKGNKKRAITLWKTLSKANKAAALAYLPKYESHLAVNKGQSKLYAETYLNQQRWNN